MTQLTNALLALLLMVGTAHAQSAVAAKIDDVTVTNAATLVKAGNAFRYALSCTVTGAVAVRWGGSDVTAAGGQRVASGASVEIFARAPIYMISEGANTTVACTEETR